MDFDKVLDRVGGYGRFQKFYVVILGLAAIPMGAMTLANVFITGIPDYMCNVPELGNLSKDQQLEISSPINGHENQHDLCNVYDVDYARLDLTLNSSDHRHIWSNETGLKSCDEWVYDDSIFSYTIVTRWNLVCGSHWRKSLAQSLYMLGYLLGALTFGSLADRIGRRPTFFIATTSFIIFGSMAAFMPTYWSHVFIRLLAGASGAGFFTTAFVIQMEIIGVEDRMVPGVMYQGWFALGYMMVAFVAYFVRTYMYLQLFISLLPVLLYSYIWLLGESPRWLMSQGRMEECSVQVKRVAKMNGTEYPEDLIEHEAKIVMSNSSIQQDKKYSLIDLLRTPNMRIKTLNVFFNWFVNSFVYYGLTFASADLAGGPYLNLFVSGIVEFVGYVPAVLLLDRIGRRLPLALLLVSAGVSCLIIAAMPKEYAVCTTIMAMIGKLAISGSFAVIYVFSAELFPTVARNTGVGSGSMSARAGGLLAPFLADLIHVWRPLPFLVFGTCSLMAGALTMLLPETLNRHLPETLDDGENFVRGKFEWYCSSSKKDYIDCPKSEPMREKNIQNGDAHI